MYDNKDVEFNSSSKIRPVNIPIIVWGFFAIGTWIISYVIDNSFLSKNLYWILGIPFGLSFILSGFIGLKTKEIPGMGGTIIHGGTAMLVSLMKLFFGFIFSLGIIASAILNILKDSNMSSP